MMISLKSLRKSYKTPAGSFPAIDLEIGKGEFVAVVGKSGSGREALEYE